jgi:hypothetical protein
MLYLCIVEPNNLFGDVILLSVKFFKLFLKLCRP